MQRHTPILNKEFRLHTDSGAPNRSMKRKTQNRSMSKKVKRKADIFNFDKFLQRLRLETIKTERFTSPNKHPYDAYDRGLSSKSRKHTRSIETSREKSGDTYRKTHRQPANKSRSKAKHPALKDSLKLLKIPSGLQFRDLATQMFNRFEQVETKIKHSDEPKDLYSLCVKYRELFGGLIKSMIEELNSLSDEKQSQILSSVENIVTLQNDILNKQSIVDKLEEQVKSFKTALEVSHRIIRQQNGCIAEMKGKESRVSRLLYAMRRRGIDVDQIYVADVQTPMEESEGEPNDEVQQQGLYEGQDGEEQSPRVDGFEAGSAHLNQSY